MRFTGLGVGSLDLQACQVCRMSIEDVMDYHKVNQTMVITAEPEYDSDMEGSCSDDEQEDGEFD